MKRILFEVIGVVALLVLVVVFAQQVSSLKVQNRDIEQIRALVETSVAGAGSKEEIMEMRKQLLERMDERLQDVESRLAEANRGAMEALEMRNELELAKEEVHRITDGFLQTQDLVNAYVDESRSKDSNTEASLATLAEKLVPDTSAMTRSMLAPTVQLNGDDTVGAGTMIFSGKNPVGGRNETYVLTSYHVVRNILADMPRSRKEEGIDVTIYLGKDREDVKGKMIAHDAKIDAALVKLRTNRVYRNVARVLAESELNQVKVWDAIVAVGCPLGNDPVPTQGQIGSLQNELNGSNYWMINAPTYFGNSGGGVYRADTRELIGVFSKIYTHGKGNPVVIPHMGLCTPIGLVHDWLEGENLDHLLDRTGTVAANPAPGK